MYGELGWEESLGDSRGLLLEKPIYEGWVLGEVPLAGGEPGPCGGTKFG